MSLRPARIEDVPVAELSGLALVHTGGPTSELLAIGDRSARLARAVLTDQPLTWTTIDLGGGAQFEGVDVAGEGDILVLCEDPPTVLVLDQAGEVTLRIALVAGKRGEARDVFDEASSAGEGLLPLRDGRLLIAKEKDPPLLVEFGPPDGEALGITARSFPATGEPMGPMGETLQALAAWELEDVDDVSDLAFAGGALYCLSDQSQRVVVVDLPLDPGSHRARVADRWDLRVPERKGEPDGKPEGLVVTADGSFIVGLDTETPRANLCWYPT